MPAEVGAGFERNSTPPEWPGDVESIRDHHNGCRGGERQPRGRISSGGESMGNTISGRSHDLSTSASTAAGGGLIHDSSDGFAQPMPRTAMQPVQNRMRGQVARV
jgi:hypothetical protein